MVLVIVMEPKWKGFERLVAAIELASQAGARVKWNDKINGRQFDVTIHFRSGLHDYLTVIECRRQASPVPVRDVDAFVTKSRDANANKAIMVSSSGFQQGAKQVAERHGIDLFTLQEEEKLPADVVVRGLIPVIQITGIQLVSGTGRVLHTLPDEANKLQFILENAVVEATGGERPLKEVLREADRAIQSKATDQPARHEIPLTRRSRIRLPDERLPYKNRHLMVGKIRFTYQLTTARLVDYRGLDLSLIPPSWAYENIVTGEIYRIRTDELDLGFDTTIETGKFYHSPRLGFNYYCENIYGELATLFLVESYQHGKFIQARLKAKLEDVRGYISIKDPVEIKRLEKMYLHVIRDEDG